MTVKFPLQSHSSHTHTPGRHGTLQFLVIGAGIAGMSLASHLVGHRRSVAVLDMEEAVLHHATGRSASLKDPVYVPNPEVAGLAMASHHLFESLPEALQPKASLHLYGAGHLRELADCLARTRSIGAEVELLETEAVEERFPFLRSGEDHYVGAIFAPAGVAHSIDVNWLYEHYRSHLRMGGGDIHRGEELIRATYSGGAWTVHTSHRTLRAEVIVNCAGAWADIVAARCGLTPLGLVPLKRTVVEKPLVPHPFAPQPEGPFVFWNTHQPLYADFKSHGRVLISPADEQVSQPCDAKPDHDHLGMAIERFLNRTHLSVASGQGRHWAGLRTFAADRRPVIGWSPEASGFFWSAAYGGFGIECAPAASRLCADLLLGEKQFARLASDHRIRPEHFAPERLQVSVHHG